MTPWTKLKHKENICNMYNKKILPIKKKLNNPIQKQPRSLNIRYLINARKLTEIPILNHHIAKINKHF